MSDIPVQTSDIETVGETITSYKQTRNLIGHPPVGSVKTRECTVFIVKMNGRITFVTQNLKAFTVTNENS